MRRFETLASVTTSEDLELTLHRRGGEHFIHLDGEELMSSRRHGSEWALASLALAELPETSAHRILIGGLGLGFTLKAAVEEAPASARIVVAELVSAVVSWHRNELAELATPLDDPRVRIVEEDVGRVLDGTADSEVPAHWDAILLDVDNGPSAWCLGSNSALYERRSLERIRASLDPGGVLAIWSAYPDEPFLKRLRKVGFHARLESARARANRGVRSFIFLAVRR